MLDAAVKPQFCLHLFGDWKTIISAERYREVLLNQKPHDEDCALYSRYTIPCDTAAELVEAHQTFRTFARCEIVVSLKSEKTGVGAFAGTGTGYGGRSHARIEVDEAKVTADMAEAVRKAVDLLAPYR